MLIKNSLKDSIKQSLSDCGITQVKRIKKIISQYEYVSFDIFDTLIKRDVEKPTDVFVLVENILNQKTGKKTFFYKKRIDAEKKARENVSSGEVTLDDIYSFITYDDEVKKIARNIEIELECKLSCHNKRLIDVYKYAVKYKKVILISDMYLPRDVIEYILRKNKIIGYEELCISNEVKCNKISGKLFDVALETLNIDRDRIVHVGNSFRADYLSPKRIGIDSVKVPTKYRCTLDMKSIDKRNKVGANEINVNSIKFKHKMLNSFIDNHEDINNDYFDKIGYESFGPLLAGFCDWLFYKVKRDGVEQVLFLARDGFIMKKAYECLGYDEIIPSGYLEVSRRSLRTPMFNPDCEIRELTKVLTLSSVTNMREMFDSLGLRIEKYLDVLEKYGFTECDTVTRDSIEKSEEFKALYSELKSDIYENQKTERKMLKGYLGQFDFSKKTAIVDIGWGGTMQRYLMEALDIFGISTVDIKGYYFGLTKRADENLKKYGYKAEGYLFDCYNNQGDYELERPFVGLFETMFLEQIGSVKSYEEKNGIISPVRYGYEYCKNNKYTKEAKYIKKIHKKAIEFVSDYKKSPVRNYIGYNAKISFFNIEQLCLRPEYKDVKIFGKFEFFNNGEVGKLACPKRIGEYVKNPLALKSDFLESRWKIGFLKALFRADLEYRKVYDLLKKFEK